MHFKAVEEIVTVTNEADKPDYSGKKITEGAKLTLYATEGGSTTELTTADSYTLQWGKEYTLTPTVIDTATYDATKTVGSIVFTIDKNGAMQVTSGNADQFTFDNDTKTIIVTITRKEYKITTSYTNEFSPNPTELKLNGDVQSKINDAPAKKGDKVAVTIEAATGCKITSVELREAGALNEMDYTVSAVGYEDKTVTIVLTDNGTSGVSVTVDGTTYSGTAVPVQLQRKTMTAEIKIVDASDNTALTDATNYTITDADNNTVTATSHQADGLNWGETYTLTVTKAADGYKMPTTATATFTFDKTGKMKVNGTEVSGNIVQMALEKTAVKLQILGANGNQLPGAAVKILNGTTEAATFTSGNSMETVEKLVTGTTYTIRVASVPEGKATPADVTVKLNADGTIAAEGTTAVYSGDTITLKIWNSIPVDANGNGTVEGSEDNATVGEPDNGMAKNTTRMAASGILPVITKIIQQPRDIISSSMIHRMVR